MALLDGSQVKRVWLEDGARRWALFEILDIVTGDQINFFDLGHFRVCKQAAFMGATVAGVTSGQITNQATVTAPSGLNHDSGYVLIDGIPL